MTFLHPINFDPITSFAARDENTHFLDHWVNAWLCVSYRPAGNKQTVHHLPGNAIPTGTVSDYDEILCHRWIPKSVVVTNILTLWVKKAENSENFTFLVKFARSGCNKIWRGGGCWWTFTSVMSKIVRTPSLGLCLREITQHLHLTHTVRQAWRCHLQYMISVGG